MKKYDNYSERKAALQRERRAEHKSHGHTDAAFIKWKYGITVEEVVKCMADQGNKCAICQNLFKDTFDTIIDHCHRDGKFRGLLCRRCNSGLGMFQDNPEYLILAAGYLQR